MTKEKRELRPAPRMASPTVLRDIREHLDALEGLVSEEEEFWNSDDVPQTAKEATDWWLLCGASYMLLQFLEPAVEDVLARLDPSATEEEAADTAEAWMNKVLVRGFSETHEGEPLTPEWYAALAVAMVTRFLRAHEQLDEDLSESFERVFDRLGSHMWDHIQDRIQMRRDEIKKKEASS